jgi:hypothetical protein
MAMKSILSWLVGSFVLLMAFADKAGGLMLGENSPPASMWLPFRSACFNDGPSNLQAFGPQRPEDRDDFQHLTGNNQESKSACPTDGNH